MGLTEISETAAGVFSRRHFLKASALIGCSVAAHPLMTTMTLAAAPWDNRLVVLILRGAMDGLDVVQPVGDPAFAALRPSIGAGAAVGAIDLDGFFAMHKGLIGLTPLWQAKELAFVHATSTPYRDKRSHFDGQDLLEAGTGFDMESHTVRDGWLNRLLQAVPGVTAETAFALGRDEMLVLSGKAKHLAWSPQSKLDLTPQSRLLLEQIYHDDPAFRDAGMAAMDLADQLDNPDAMRAAKVARADLTAAMHASNAKAKPDPLAEFAAARLNDETRIAAFSVSGWDTHKDQANGLGNALGALTRTILTLKNGLGANWAKTTVIAMTEFGRTAAENGSRGTDHGTGGAMLLAGGAVRGGKVYGQWPGLAEADLYDRRDLMPTSDVRTHAAWVMQGMFGLDASVLSGAVFPGLDMGRNPGLLL